MENNARPHGHEQLINVRNRLFNQMFRRIALRYGSHVPYKYRRLIEVNLFAKACIFFFMLVFLHFTIFNKSFVCLSEELTSWPRDGILRVEIIQDAAANYTLADSYRKQYRNYKPAVAPPPRPRATPTPPFNHSYYDPDGFTIANANHTAPAVKAPPPPQYNVDGGDDVRDILEIEEIAVDELQEESFAHQLFKEFLWDFNATEYNDHYIIEYSLNNGFLYLRPEIREKFNISVMLKVIDPMKDKCLEASLDRIILEVLGYNDVLLSSVKSIIQKENHKGYLLNVMLGEQYRFVYIWTSRLKYIPAFVFMVIFTLIVSMLLRYSHHQIFIFILRLIQNFEMNSRLTFPIAPFITIILALVGIEEIMTDFFNDTSTAFYIILIVWIADQYDSICCNNPTSKKYWLWFFFLYHYMFYAYHYRFNGHHSQLALFSSWLFILHSMVYFFHHYELPCLENLEAATRLTIDNQIQDVTQIRLIYHGHINQPDSLPTSSSADNVIRVSSILAAHIADLRTPSTADHRTPSTTDFRTPSTTDLQTPSTTDLQTPSTTDLQTPSTTYLQTPSTTDLQTPSTTHLQTPYTTDPQTPSTTDLQPPSFTDLEHSLPLQQHLTTVEVSDGVTSEKFKQSECSAEIPSQQFKTADRGSSLCLEQLHIGEVGGEGGEGEDIEIPVGIIATDLNKEILTTLTKPLVPTTNEDSTCTESS